MNPRSPERAGASPPLAYEPPESSPPSSRPAWVLALVGLYLLLLLAVLLFPAWVYWAEGSNPNDTVVGAIYVSALIVSGLTLVIVPVKANRRRPISRRSIWFPIIGSGFLLGVLVFGAGLALWELFKFGNWMQWPVLIGSLAVWAGWSILFGLIAFRRDPGPIAATLHRWVLAGSLLELLVAVPSHVIVRRRNECCATIATGTAICIGVSVMFIALGPSVLILFYRRCKRILPPANPSPV
jgi:hypothetical protein